MPTNSTANIIAIKWLAFLIVHNRNTKIQRCCCLLLLLLSLTKQWNETDRLNDLKEVKRFQNLLLRIWPADCFNDCVTAVKLITIIARYSTLAVGLWVPIVVTLRFCWTSFCSSHSLLDLEPNWKEKHKVLKFHFAFTLIYCNTSRLLAAGK